MGLRGSPETGGGSLGAAISALDGVARRATGGKTKAFFEHGTELRRAARGASLAGINGAVRIHEAEGGPRA